MSIFGRLGEWIGSASELSSLMSRSDAIVLQLTGNNPKHFHPKLYRLLLDSVKERNDSLHFMGQPLNEYEAALIVLSLLCTGAREASNRNPAHRIEVYERAINSLRKQQQHHIRPEISIDGYAISGSTNGEADLLGDPDLKSTPTKDLLGLVGQVIGASDYKQISDYGYDPSDPILCADIISSKLFLGALRHKGHRVKCERQGSVVGPEGRILDLYDVSASEGHVANLYIDAHAGISASRKAPHGFTLSIE